jgi:K+-sensing histidine kinase KdpD
LDLLPGTHDAVAAEQRASAPQAEHRRPLDILLRAQPLPRCWGIVVAATFILAEAGLVHLLQSLRSENSFRAVFLLGVLVVSAGWEFPLALATTFVSGLLYFCFHVDRGGPVDADDLGALLVFFRSDS